MSVSASMSVGPLLSLWWKPSFLVLKTQNLQSLMWRGQEATVLWDSLDKPVRGLTPAIPWPVHSGTGNKLLCVGHWFTAHPASDKTPFRNIVPLAIFWFYQTSCFWVMGCVGSQALTYKPGNLAFLGLAGKKTPVWGYKEQKRYKPQSFYSFWKPVRISLFVVLKLNSPKFFLSLF